MKTKTVDDTGLLIKNLLWHVTSITKGCRESPVKLSSSEYCGLVQQTIIPKNLHIYKTTLMKIQLR